MSLTVMSGQQRSPADGLRAFLIVHIMVFQFKPGLGEGGLLPYVGYIGMCGPKGYSFVATSVTCCVLFLTKEVRTRELITR